MCKGLNQIWIDHDSTSRPEEMIHDHSDRPDLLLELARQEPRRWNTRPADLSGTIPQQSRAGGAAHFALNLHITSTIILKSEPAEVGWQLRARNFCEHIRKRAPKQRVRN